MSISSQTNRVTYAGNGATTAFAYSFPINTSDGSDIQVWICDDDGALTLLTSNYSLNLVTAMVNYPTVGGVSPLDPGVTALPSGWSMIILRIEPLTQNLSLQNSGVFDAASINNELDKLTMITQQLQEQLNRSIKYPLNVVPTSAQLDPDDLTVSITQPIVSGTFAQLLAAAQAAPSTVFLCIATDLGTVGQFGVYMGSSSVGEQGFVFFGGG